MISARSHFARDLREEYEEDGYYNAIPVLSEEELERIHEGYLAYQDKVPKHIADPYKHKVHLLSSWADTLVHHPKVLDAVEAVLGENILCWTSNLLVKDAKSGAFVSWHQDSGYWGLEPAEVVTAWIALTPSTKDSGCMQVLPATHRGEDYSHRDTFDKDNMLTRGQELELEIHADDTVALELQPGEMSLHHIKLAHASGPNFSAEDRVGFAIRYMSANVKKEGAKESALLVRGERGDSDFIPETRLNQDWSAAARLQHNRALRRQVANNYRSHGKGSFAQRLRLTLKKLVSELFLDMSSLPLRLGIGARH